MTDQVTEPEDHEDSKLKGGRGKDTLLRITLRNQVDQIAIADNKSNMIISVNTIIVSLIIAGLGSGLSFTELNLLAFPKVLAPLTILMIFCTFSAIFSIFAAKPAIFKGNPQQNPASDSLLFFGNFRDLSLDEYIEEVYKIFNSPRGIYRTLLIDVYYNRKVLMRKYRLLSYSYTSFLVGLVLCVVTYLVLFQTT